MDNDEFNDQWEALSDSEKGSLVEYLAMEWSGLATFASRNKLINFDGDSSEVEIAKALYIIDEMLYMQKDLLVYFSDYIINYPKGKLEEIFSSATLAHSFVEAIEMFLWMTNRANPERICHLDDFDLFVTKKVIFNTLSFMRKRCLYVDRSLGGFSESEFPHLPDLGAEFINALIVVEETV